MADDLSKKRLGRGLAALIGDMDQPAPAAADIVANDRTLPIEMIERSARNPRRQFSDEELQELSVSISRHGIIQPIVVRSLPGQTGRERRYEIIAGERRWRAAQRAGLTDVPVIIHEADDREALELAIIENVQRSDLNAVEEALGYQQLIDEHAYTQGQLGEVIGKSRSHVANTLRLLKLPQDVRDMLVNGDLSAGHARTLVTADDPSGLARRIIAKGLSVRDAEELASRSANGSALTGRSAAPKPGKVIKDADTLALEKSLSDALGLQVDLNHGEKGGDVRIHYTSLDQLDEICRLLQRG